ncbi:MAG TPA: hypothetical protein VFM55_19560 [Micromonosporaceae bacterium]|nr:hypothetical protein [Micromonosporaceae bacterium]
MSRPHTKRFQAMHHDGATGRVRSAGRFSTAETARRTAETRRAALPAGSSDWLTVEATRRKGRRS